MQPCPAQLLLHACNAWSTSIVCTWSKRNVRAVKSVTEHCVLTEIIDNVSQQQSHSNASGL